MAHYDCSCCGESMGISHEHCDYCKSGKCSRAMREQVPEPAPTLNPWHPITNSVTLKHLGKLSEELGECSAAVSRCIIQGVDETEPVTGKSNREWLEDEMADVIANIQLVVDHLGLDEERMLERAEKKQTRLREWHRMV